VSAGTALAASMNARALRAARPTATLVAGRRQTTTMGLFGLGGPELLVIGVVAAVVFGPSKLPELGKTLGKTAKSFQGAAEVRYPVQKRVVVERAVSSTR
jgi:TatA/E family protein of Tat protein translocase